MDITDEYGNTLNIIEAVQEVGEKPKCLRRVHDNDLNRYIKR